MTHAGQGRTHGRAAADAAIESIAALLDELRDAMVLGDVATLEQARTRLQALMSDPAWRDDAGQAPDPARLRAAPGAAAVGAGLAARGEAQAARALAALAVTPALYTAAGGLGARGATSRGVSA